MIDYASLGWQIVALVVAATLARIAFRFFERDESKSVTTEYVRGLREDINALAGAQSKATDAAATGLKALDSRLSLLESRATSLEQVNEVTRPPTQPGAIGPFLPRRKAGTT